MRLVPVLFWCAGLAGLAADLTPETLLLQRARVVMAENLRRLPNYTCLQTIERSARPSLTKKPKLLDVVRIEVALVNGKELFAWPGSGDFTDTEIGDMVAGGAIGNGNFALHAKSVFQTGSPRFTYRGQALRGMRRTHHWDFVVSQNLSGYTLRVGDREAVVGYHGSFWVDASSLDLIRLEVHADDIPPFLGLLSASDAVEYARLPIGGESFLLPAGSELEMIDLTGATSENRTKFSRCRQYSGESTLLFDDPAPNTEAPVPPARILDAPGGVRLHLAIHSPVLLEDAAVGDPVSAVLLRTTRLPDGTVIPKNAFVHGRLMMLRKQQLARFSGYAVGLTFFEIESGSTRVRMGATLEDIQTAHPGFRMQSGFGRFGGMATRPENEDLVGSVFFLQEHLRRLDRGLRMVWRTTPFRPEDRQ